jgi:hypothetical protein
MINKKILMGAAIGTAGLVALTGATFADTGSQAASRGGGIKDRVAEILGIAPETLQSAFQQAREEHQDEVIADRLANAVEEGKITQEEADAILSWLDAKPEVLDGLRGFGKRSNIGMLVGAAMSPEQMPAKLDQLVEAGVISEGDAQVVKDWIAGAPVDALAKLGPQDGDRPGHDGQDDVDDDRGHEGHHRGFNGRMFGEGPGGRMFEGRFHIRPYAPQVGPDDSGTGANTATPVVAGDPV